MIDKFMASSKINGMWHRNEVLDLVLAVKMVA